MSTLRLPDMNAWLAFGPSFRPELKPEGLRPRVQSFNAPQTSSPLHTALKASTDAVDGVKSSGYSIPY